MEWNNCQESHELAQAHPLQTLQEAWPQIPAAQFPGRNCQVQPGDFPDGLVNNGVVVSSPENIIHCFQQTAYYAGVRLVSSWGTMGRTRPLRQGENVINAQLTDAANSIAETESVEEAWGMLTQGPLHWTDTMASKVLHFLSRAILPEHNDHPVPIDGAVIVNTVWPAWANVANLTPIKKRQLKWRDNRSWAAYNRYMTVMRDSASDLNWSTTQFENTLFAIQQ